jgi:type I restriction enzyme S subunit
MKPSGIEWIGGIPADWVVSKVKYACDIIMGQSPDSSEVNDINGRYQFMQGNAEFTDLYPNPILFCDKPNKRSRVGDILMSVRAPVGEMNISDKVYGIGRGLCSIKPLRLFDKYFWYFMLKSKDDFSFYTNGSTFDAITTSNLLDFSVLLPPPKEQQAIAAFFDNQCDKIDGIIAEIERQIEVLKQYKTSLITETINNHKAAEGTQNRAIRFKLIMSMQSGDAITNESLTEDASMYPVYGGGKLMGYYDKYNATSDNILVGRVGANCGCVTLLEGKAWATDNALIVKSLCEKQYLYYLLTAAELNTINETNTQPLITAGKVLNQKTAYSYDATEQKSIAAFLDKKCNEIAEIIQNKRQSVETMRAYKKSLIHEYVTGKKRVKGYQ